MTYEGARSITGPYLALLGASGTAVGIIAGVGEFIGYGFRVVSGYLADKTAYYWTITFIGYAINLLAIPFLALANSWEMAGFLIILERFGKAVRGPPKDAMLSYATKHVGRGWGFGLHETLDQIGAIAGPLVVMLILFFKKSYVLAFATLAIPALLALIMLLVTRLNFPKPSDMEKRAPAFEAKPFSHQFWIYLLAIGCVAAGFIDFALISYHFQKIGMPAVWIPFLYAIAMSVDGLTALFMGRLFDLKGILSLAVVTAITAFFSPFLFLGGFSLILIGMILWGIGLGAQETIMKAVVANLVPPNKRATAYGIFNLIFGTFWAIGSGLMGYFYDVSITALILFSILAQLASIPIFLLLK
ncbi:MAG TPA: MFS transporter [Myxococcota bacterium]|nr:MFS transporter [Myxococcota bacterium]